MKRILTTVCLLGAVCGTAAAQKYPERRHIRSGNGQYEKGDYTGAEVSYLRALEKTPHGPGSTGATPFSSSASWKRRSKPTRTR